MLEVRRHIEEITDTEDLRAQAATPFEVLAVLDPPHTHPTPHSPHPCSAEIIIIYRNRGSHPPDENKKLNREEMVIFYSGQFFTGTAA